MKYIVGPFFFVQQIFDAIQLSDALMRTYKMLTKEIQVEDVKRTVEKSAQKIP